MNASDCFPWRRRSSTPHRSEFPLVSLQDQMNRLFDGFFTGFTPALFEGSGGESSFVPKLSLSEDEKELRVSAELPGMDEKDIELTLTKEALTLKGQKRLEQEEKREGRAMYVERSFGSFQRTIPLNVEVDTDKVDASFKKGVLTIVLPKREPSSNGTKKISIRSAA